MRVSREYEVDIADWDDMREKFRDYVLNSADITLISDDAFDELVVSLIDTFTHYADVGEYELELHLFKTHGLLEDGVQEMYNWAKEDEEPEEDWIWGPVAGIVQELGSTITK